MEKLIQSCKDYDDDIEELRGQINSNKEAIAELQKLVGDGNFVKSVAKSGNKLVVTMSKGAPVEIELGEAAKGGNVVEIAANGEITIDGKGTGFFASKTKAPYVNAEGELITFNEKGEEVKTGIMKVSAVKNLDGSYTLSVPGADGKMMNIVLPSAASAIAEAKFEVDSHADNSLTLEGVTFKFKGSSTITKAEEWKGSKTLLKDNQVVVNNNNTITLTLSPATVDGTKLEYTLVNAKGETAKNVSFTATRDANGSASGRAASNSAKYTLKMNPVTFEKEDAYTEWDKQFGTKEAPVQFALCANGVVCTDYAISFAEKTTVKDGNTKYATAPVLHIVKASATATNGKWDSKAYVTEALDQNTLYKVIATDASHNDYKPLYDMYYSVASNDETIYGIVAGEEANTFKVTKKVAGTFTININAINVGGVVTSVAVKGLKVSEKIDANASYETITHAIVPNKGGEVKVEKNFFVIDLAAMKASLGDNLAQWTKDAKFLRTTVCSDAEGKTPIVRKQNNTNEYNCRIYDAFGAVPEYYSIYDGKAFKDENKVDVDNNGYGTVNFIKVTVNNAIATSQNLTSLLGSGFTKTEAMKPNTTYSIKLEYATEGQWEITGALLNSIVVPVKFTIPTVASQYEASEYYTPEAGVYKTYFEASEKTPTFDIANFFKNKPKATYTLASVAGETNAEKMNKMASISISKVTLEKVLKAHPAYGKEIVVNAATTDYLGWAYEEADQNYTIKLSLQSPIYDGDLQKENFELNFDALNSAAGDTIKAEKLHGLDYRGVKFNIAQDQAGKFDAEDVWTSDYIGAKGVVLKGGKFITVESYEPKEGNVCGFRLALNDKANLIKKSEEDSFKVTVTDIWGFVKEHTVNVKILFGADQKK